MSPQSSGTDLLYVAEYGHSEVQVFSYPQDKLVGTLTGLYYPGGECTDAAGDVFVANVASDDVSEFEHGGTAPIATYVAKKRHPFACSVDPTTGDLAVTEYGEGSVRDSLAVFFPQRDHVEYAGSLLIYIGCSYDAHGNLFVDGYDDARNFRMLELPKGGSKFQAMVLDKKFKLVGDVQWDGQYIAISDANKTIYRFVFAGTKGKMVGATVLGGIHDGLKLFSIYDGTILVPHVVHQGSLFGKGLLEFYNYPGGGMPVKMIKPLDGPDDAVVSPYLGSR